MSSAALDRVVMVRDVAVDSSSIDGGTNDGNFAPAALNGDENGIGGGNSVKSEEEDVFDGSAEMPSIKLTEIRDNLSSNAARLVDSFPNGCNASRVVQ